MGHFSLQEWLPATQLRSVGIEPVPCYLGTSPYWLLGRDMRPGSISVPNLLHSFDLAKKTPTPHTLLGFWAWQDLQPKSQKVWKIRLKEALIGRLINVLHVLKARSDSS